MRKGSAIVLTSLLWDDHGDAIEVFLGALDTSQIEKGDCMNKGELIDAVAASAGLSRADATKAVDAVLDNVTRTLAGGDTVSLVGFGTFSVKSRAARTGRNPRTGEPIQIAASKVPGFKAGKALKDAVN